MVKTKPWWQSLVWLLLATVFYCYLSSSFLSSHGNHIFDQFNQIWPHNLTKNRFLSQYSSKNDVDDRVDVLKSSKNKKVTLSSKVTHEAKRENNFYTKFINNVNINSATKKTNKAKHKSCLLSLSPPASNRTIKITLRFHSIYY